MKRILLFLIVGFFLQAPLAMEAQILGKLKKKVEKKVEKEIDKALEEEKVESVPKEEQTKEEQTGEEEHVQAQEPSADQEPKLVWVKYDFVPGDKVIFEDNQENEENGEFPSRWDLKYGTIENAEFGGEKVIMFRGGQPMIIPYLKNPEKDYLPDVFTIEFDLYTSDRNAFTVYFYDRKNQRPPTSYTANLNIRAESMELRPAKSSIPDKGSIQNQWAHISIAYTNGKMKAYIDDTRLINIPHLDFNPSGISLHAYFANDTKQYYIKNFRLAEGGVKYYDRFVQDGKIVANGIRFDVNKATLKPESMGVINEIYKLMSKHHEINFSVEGHTDSDGEKNFNQNLSEERALTVMKQLIAMGISSDRLMIKGFGESKPIDVNDTQEGKANNRRVEFVKMTEAKSRS
ncbi:MAG: OmpA family protein [Maribacter sp.]|nr:OmpA family protein [Maribacter sp.]